MGLRAMWNQPPGEPKGRSWPGIEAAGMAQPAGDLIGQEWPLRSNLQQRPEDFESMAKLAAVVARQGRTGEAIELLRRALGHAPDDHKMRLDLVDLLRRHGDVEG